MKWKKSVFKKISDMILIKKEGPKTQNKIYIIYMK